MSFFPVPIIRPRLYTRHIIEDWEYQWNAERRTYERVCYRPIQVVEPENNPIDSTEGMTLYPAEHIRLEDLDREVQELLKPVTLNQEVSPEPSPRPAPPNFGRRDHLSPGDSGRLIVVDSTSPVNVHIIVTEPPASPDPAPPCSPVNSPTASPPVSPSRVRCNSPVYIPLQYHQYALSDCPIPTTPSLNDPSLGMTGELWLSASQQRPRPKRQRRRAPSPPGNYQTPPQRRRAPPSQTITQEKL